MSLRKTVLNILNKADQPLTIRDIHRELWQDGGRDVRPDSLRDVLESSRQVTRVGGGLYRRRGRID